jgi:hypothetical protein
MKVYKTDKMRFIAGFIFIAIIYTCFYIFFAENVDAVTLPKKLKLIIVFLSTITVYFVGTMHLGKLKDPWMSSIWHFVHISGLCIIGLIGSYYWFFETISWNLKEFAKSIQEILISPVLYLAMGLLNKSLNKEKIK